MGSKAQVRDWPWRREAQLWDAREGTEEKPGRHRRGGRLGAGH